MPGINHGPDAQLALRLASYEQRLRALEAQQQIGVTNPQGQQVLTVGLVPGSDPAAYGMQVLDPTTGQQLAFMGENAGSSQFVISVSAGGTIELTSVATGKTVFFVGTTSIPDGSGRTQQVLHLTRDDGTAALQLADNGTVLNHAHQQALQWYDRSGNVVLADDTVSGVGLARPHLPLGTLSNTNTTTWYSTSATTWTGIGEMYVERQHPQLLWQFQVYAPASTNGSFRLMLNGTQIGATKTVSGGTGGTFVLWADQQPWPSSASWGNAYLLQLEAEVTSGTGTILAEQQYLAGVQS